MGKGLVCSRPSAKQKRSRKVPGLATNAGQMACAFELTGASTASICCWSKHGGFTLTVQGLQELQQAASWQPGAKSSWQRHARDAHDFRKRIPGLFRRQSLGVLWALLAWLWLASGLLQALHHSPRLKLALWLPSMRRVVYQGARRRHMAREAVRS